MTEVDNFVEIYQRSIRENWDRDALSDYFKNETLKYSDLAREIIKLHLLFAECKIKAGDRIAIIGRNNIRWCVSFLATTTYGAVAVPILQDFNSNDIQHILIHSESIMLFVGDQYWDVIDTEQLPDIRAVLSLTNFNCLYKKNSSHRLELYCSEQRIHRRFPRGLTPNDLCFPKVANDRLMELNYTSGTTGFSKGVMLTGENLAGNLKFGEQIRVHFPGSRALSFLPLAHAYGCMFEFLYPLAMGAHVTLLGKIPSPKILIEAMDKVKPNVIFCVPMIIEKMYKKQIMPILEKSITKFVLKIPIIDQAMYGIICAKMVEAFGGHFDQLIIGGAALNPEVEEFLRRIKFPFTVGYGMTEAAPLISYAPPEEFKEGSCGRILEGLMEVTVDSPDPQRIVGEILVRGRHVMKGYYKNPEATSSALDDQGWLHTGDLGTVDEDGTIYIRGRSKSMILGASGQNIFPEEIESKLNNLPCVMESLVVDRKGRLVALVYPDYELAELFGADNQQKLEKVMKENLETLNQMVAPYERIAEIALYPTEFEKTPKRSIKRYLYNV